jgi:peroxiredoxin/outer membrane lipoprotein-sorting protein
VFALSAWAADPANIADVFSHTAASYKKLKSYQIDGNVSVAIANRSGQSGFQLKTTLAADDQGRSYVSRTGAEGTEIRVSNGSQTWKYNSLARQWSKEELAQAGADEESEDDAPEPQDLFSQTAHSFVNRYLGLWRVAKRAEYLKDDKVKFNGQKVICHVYRIAGLKGTVNELWISDQEFYVLRHVEKSPTSEVTMEVKKISDGAPEPALFDFEPPKGAKEVSNLSLPSERNASLVGTRANDFTLKTLDGEAGHLAELRGKVVLLDFWASWCPPCRHELPTIAALNQKLAGTNAVVLGINDEEAKTAKRYLTSSHMELQTLHDDGRKVARAYSCYAIPTVVIIDPSGKVVAHYVGERSEKEFMASLREAGLK